MPRKQTLMVSDLRCARGGWKMTLQSSNLDALTDIVSTIRETSQKRGLVMINATDPFGETEKPPRKKWTRKTPEAAKKSEAA